MSAPIGQEMQYSGICLFTAGIKQQSFLVQLIVSDNNRDNSWAPFKVDLFQISLFFPLSNQKFR